jgi:putative ABC transport system permease protein
MFEGKPVFRVDDRQFSNESTLAADSNFLRVFSFDFVYGDVRALDQPNQIALTDKTARKYFGTDNPIGQCIQSGQGPLLTVSAVIADPPGNSHLQFDALISWSTFRRDDQWGNLNAYTYIELKPDAPIVDVGSKMPALLRTFHELVAREYKATYEPVFENITSIHLSEPLDEDIATRNDANNVPILAAVALLFLITGLVNYLNLSLAEVTASLRKLGIIRIFGGAQGSHHRVLLAETVAALLVAMPLVILLFYGGVLLSRRTLGIGIGWQTLRHPIFIGLSAVPLFMVLAASWGNALLLSRASQVVHSLKGKLTARLGGTTLRKALVGIQVALSVVMMALMNLVVDQFNYIQTADKGFSDGNVIVVKLRSGEPNEIESFIQNVRDLPGIAGVEGSSYYPGIIETKYVFEIEEASGIQERLVPMMVCGYDYFETLGIQTAAGRPFSRIHESDRDWAFVINETAAREFGWKHPLGKRIRGPIGGSGDAFREGEVIGVLRDFNFDSFHSKIEPMIIFLNDESWYASQFIYIKTMPIPPPNLVSSIKDQYERSWADPFDWEYLDVKYQSLYYKDRVTQHVLQIGLVISVVLCCLGIYSLSALLLRLRTKEAGIRKVVGADLFHLVSMHLKPFFVFLLVSVPVALPCFLLLSRWWLATFAYHIAIDLKHFGIPVFVAIAIVIFTSGYHAVRGALMNPADCLRHE